MKITTATLMLAAAMGGSATHAAEITVMSAGAVKSGLTEGFARWEKQTGHKVNVGYFPAGDLRKKIAAGERADILIIPVENFEALNAAGAIDLASRHDLAAVAMGAAVKAGTPVPDISTAEKLKATLLSAKSVTYMDPNIGTSGKHFDESVLPKLGIRDQVRAKAKLGEGGYIAEKVAQGEVEIAFHNVTEILPVKGVTFVGLIPAEFQKTTVYSGVILKGAKNPGEAQALLDHLVAPEARKNFLDRGYTAP
jgi:molybdate transport system substrate-binding protein